MAEEADGLDGRTIKIHKKGDSPEKFIKGDFPTGMDYSEEEKMEMFRQKNYAVVTIEIRAASGRTQFTVLVDNFNLHLVNDNINDNTEVISKKLENLIPQINKLIEKWTMEMG